MATARKLPSGKYRCLIYEKIVDGKRKYRSFTAPTKKEAELLADKYAFTKERKEEKSKTTFSEELKSYIEIKENVLSPSTIYSYKGIQKRLKNDFKDFCSLRIDDITSKEVQTVINVLAKTNSPKTVRNFYGLITAVLGPTRRLSATLPQRIQPDIYIPSDEEIKRLIDATKNTELEIPILLGAFGMMRRGEICGLSMSDIEGNIVHIHHSVVIGDDGEWHKKAPKTETSDRYVEIPWFVADRIRELNCITNVTPNSITMRLLRVLKKLGIPHFRFHDLRHYSASIRHALGIPDAYIMADGGWSSDRVLKSVYRHAMADKKSEMSNKANNYFSEICNTKCNTK